MSIDNFWSLPETKEHPVFDPPLIIEPSIYTKGNSSFKGKKYSLFLENEFSLTLFKKEILQEVKIISVELSLYKDTSK